MSSAIKCVGLLLLIAPAYANVNGWQYQTQKDEMRAVTNKWAILKSENVVELERPYAGGSNLQVHIRNMPKTNGTDVILLLSQGQLLCRFSGCPISVKFDDGKVLEYTAISAPGTRNSMIFISDSQTARFIKRIQAAKRVIIEVPVWRRGPEQFIFSSSSALKWK